MENFTPVPVGDTFAGTDYAYCRGATDAWCVTLQYPREELGAFQIGFTTKFSQMADGTSHTIAMGEAAGGDRWPLCNGPGCDTPDATGKNADVPWAIGNLGADFMLPSGILSSIYGCMIEPMNKWPVTNTLLSTSDVLDCRRSLNGGNHSVSNFRSDHPGGGQFLFCDGSVHFLEENIEMETYRGLSTIAGGEVDSQ